MNVEKVLFTNAKSVLLGYCGSATDPEWGRLLIASLRTDQAKKMRERLYMIVIGDLSEDEIDELQEYCLHLIPLYIRRTMSNECQYRVQTAIATDLGKENDLRTLYYLYWTMTCLLHPVLLMQQFS